MSFLLWLLMPIAFLVEWLFSSSDTQKKNELHDIHSKSQHYLTGINYLLNEQPDKALDVFIKMLEVDHDTVETHLALGSLFRRKGEVERAIRIHQNIIARPNLTSEQKSHALLALGQDYLKSGMLDRAEGIFTEIVDSGIQTTSGLKFLVDIYQREKAWEDAIVIAKKLQGQSGEDWQQAISHFYCELALQYYQLDSKSAEEYLLKALQADKKNVRANLILGQIALESGHVKQAIKYLQQIKSQNPEFLSEALNPLAKCYDQLGQSTEFVKFLKSCLKEHARISVVLILAEYVNREYGLQAAIDLIAEYLKIHPSLRGLKRLIELQLAAAHYIQNQNLPILRDITLKMLENKPVYRCSECGFGAKTMHWQCPGCRNWNTVKPIHGLEGD